MISLKSSGSFDNILNFLKRVASGDIFGDLDSYGEMGVRALSSATPVDTGETAASWSYRVIRSKGQTRIEWYNTNEVDGVNIAVIRQLGHGTGTGGWVEGLNYINPAIRPVFEMISNAAWEEVSR